MVKKQAYFKVNIDLKLGLYILDPRFEIPERGSPRPWSLGPAVLFCNFTYQSEITDLPPKGSEIGCL